MNDADKAVGAAVAAAVDRASKGRRSWSAVSGLAGHGDTVGIGDLVVVAVQAGVEAPYADFQGKPLRVESFGRDREGRIWLVAYARHLRTVVTFRAHGVGWIRTFTIVGKEPAIWVRPSRTDKKK